MVYSYRKANYGWINLSSSDITFLHSIFAIELSKQVLYCTSFRRIRYVKSSADDDDEDDEMRKHAVAEAGHLNFIYNSPIDIDTTTGLRTDGRRRRRAAPFRSSGSAAALLSLAAAAAAGP
ncbi:unnamed protein product [Haemonchus placei]|uniref:Uncharacterized protein n=1 Tax=Haemonchus placei TaxID=6290 RepID=A0A0N4WHP3_HAEPC|nr:unnamed protein product [Haemonchus placei]